MFKEAENEYASASDSLTVNGFTETFGGSGTFVGITILFRTRNNYCT